MFSLVHVLRDVLVIIAACFGATIATAVAHIAYTDRLFLLVKSKLIDTVKPLC